MYNCKGKDTLFLSNNQTTTQHTSGHTLLIDTLGIDTLEAAQGHTKRSQRTEETAPGSFITNQPHKLLFESRVIKRENQDWITGIILLCLFLFVWIRFIYRPRFQQIIQAFWAKNYANQMIRDGNLFGERIFLPLMLISFLSLALLFFEIVQLYALPSIFTPDFLFYLGLLGFLIGYWILRFFLIRGVGFIFKTQSYANEYLVNSHIYMILNGLFMLPILILATFFHANLFTLIGLGVIAIVFILWLFRGISIGLHVKAFSGLHLFLYLCTLELLPWIILTKLIINSKLF